MLDLVLMIACAVAFYKAADIEQLDSPLLWGVASCVVYVASSWLTGWGFIAGLGGQAVLFIWLGVWIYLQGRRKV